MLIYGHKHATETHLKAKPFVLNPANLDFVDGIAPFTPPRTRLFSCSTLMLIPFLLAGLFIVGATLHEWDIFLQLRSTGIDTQAQIIESWEDSSGDETAYYFRVSFTTTDARQHESRAQISRDFYRQYNAGDTLTIRYLPHNPDEVRADWATNNFPHFPIFLTLFTLAWNTVIWGAFIGTLMHNRKLQRLALGGETLLGEITRIKGDKDDDGDYNVTVHYTFQSPIGATLNGKETQQRNDLKDAALPYTGTTIAVYYRDERTYMML